MKKTCTAILAAGCLVFQAWSVRAAALDDLPKWKFGDDKLPKAVEELITKTPLDQRGPIEDALIKVVASADSTSDARGLSCRMLQRIGTKKCVPALSGLLGDKVLSHYARLALERIVDCPEAGQALKDGLGKVADPILKVGIIASLGERREAAAAADIQKLVSSADETVAANACLALGKIGGADVMKFLQEAKPKGKAAAARVNGLLLCAEKCEGAEAAKVYEAIYKEEKANVHRAGALIGLVRTDGPKGTALVISLMKEKDSYLRRVAMSCIAGVKNTELTKTIAAALKDLEPAQRASTIGVLGKRGDPAAIDSIAAFLQDGDQHVRDAAIAAVGALGNGTHVPLLLKCVNNESTKTQALVSIEQMKADDVNAAIVAKLVDKELGGAAMLAAAKRDCAEAVPELLKLAKSGDAAVQAKAWEAIGLTATAEHMDVVMAALLEIKNEKLKGTAANAVKYACGHAKDKQKCFEAAAKYYGQADEATKEFVLDLAPVAGGSKALELVREALEPAKRKLYDKAVRSLCAWPDKSAANDLIGLVKTGADDKTKILATRGYIEVAAREANEGTRAKLLADIRPLIKRPEEKKHLISKLGSTRDVVAIKMLSEYLADAEVQNDASAAAARLGDTMRGRYRGKGKNEIKALLDKVIATCKDKNIQKRAQQVRKGIR